MTIEDFNNQGWTGGMKAEFKNKIYDIINCDFENKKVGLDIDGELVEISYKLCEIVKVQE